MQRRDPLVLCILCHVVLVVDGRHDLGMGWARRSTPGKVEGAGGVPSVVPDNSSAGAYRQTFFSRPFTLNWREKSKV
jgi:hypothetical protein